MMDFIYQQKIKVNAKPVLRVAGYATLRMNVLLAITVITCWMVIVLRRVR